MGNPCPVSYQFIQKTLFSIFPLYVPVFITDTTWSLIFTSSTYDLMETAEKVIVFGSTMGAEALMLASGLACPEEKIFIF